VNAEWPLLVILGVSLAKWRGYPQGGVVVCRKWMVGRVETELRLKVLMGNQCSDQIIASVKLKDSSLIVCKS
jgi:hypothetical protein